MTSHAWRNAIAWGFKFILPAALAVETVSCAHTALPPAAEFTGDSFPSVVLSNGLVDARVYLPDASAGYYRGPRFDWSGMVGPVEYAGHHFFGPFRVPHDSLGNDDGIGPAEEFGMDEALGYAEAMAPAPFIKIGVGELIKPDDPEYAGYHFYKPFKIVASPHWKVEHGKDWIEFNQNVQGPRGWGYDYVKRVSLARDKPILIIQHRLMNTGSNVIDTTWYCHNLVNIDGQAIGPEYRVRFPFEPTFKEMPKSEDIRMQGNELIFVRELPPHYGASAELMNFDGVKSDRATIVDTQTGGGVEISGDQPLIKYHFYAESTAVCPEMFIRIHIMPGGSQTWETRYEFMGEKEKP